MCKVESEYNNAKITATVEGQLGAVEKAALNRISAHRIHYEIFLLLVLHVIGILICSACTTGWFE